MKRHSNLTAAAARLHRRHVLKGIAGAGVTAGLGLYSPAVLAQAKKFAGVTIRGACFQHIFHENIKTLLPEFEEATGMKVEIDLQAFPVYNQRMDLELSTQGSSYDFINITFPYSGRWVGAGWLAPLNEFLDDRNQTPEDWDPNDFVAATQIPFRGKDEKTYGFAWDVGAMMMGIARYDLVEKAGLKMPQTLDELVAVCEATHGQDGVSAFVADRLHHWNFPPYLMNMGGKVFRGAPDDLMPTLDTPEAAKAADLYAGLLRKYAPQGVLSYTDDQAMRNQLEGRANIRTTAMAWLLPLGKSEASTVRDTMRYGMIPAGPGGSFPGSNSNGFGIPAGSRQKEAGWAYIQWATSKETFRRVASLVSGHAVPRRSVIDDPQYRAGLQVNGQDVAALYLEVLEKTGAGGYMNYRTVPVFPQVGDKINKAIERIATGQQEAAASMAQAQAEAVDDLRKAGVRL
jgi:multiple sugar transport system substrate-binding protein